MNENKAEICAELGELLKLTLAGADIDRIEYDEESDGAVVYYKSTSPYGFRRLNTAGDSGAQMIADAVTGLLWGDINESVT
ncbi:MAG: hypothetical protein HDT42_04755 [Ruminococcaceae bacterium]|nr:hypothetical protein [Oscillospiraceae bacterium]